MKNMISIISALLMLLSVSAGAVAPESDGYTAQPSVVETEMELPAITGSLPDKDTNTMERKETGIRISVKSEQHEIIYELIDSVAAGELYAQLPLTVEVEPFSKNEMTFYPQKLDVTNAPLSDGAAGSLSYYEPWGDVVMFYAPCPPNISLYELGVAVSGAEHIADLSGIITVSAVE